MRRQSCRSIVAKWAEQRNIACRPNLLSLSSPAAPHYSSVSRTLKAESLLCRG